MARTDATPTRGPGSLESWSTAELERELRRRQGESPRSSYRRQLLEPILSPHGITIEQWDAQIARYDAARKAA